MNILIAVIVALAILLLLFNLLVRQRRKPVIITPIPDEWKTILLRDIPFYNKLDENNRQQFEHRMMHFLATTRITGINTEVEELDRIYIAASAIIPIFGFNNWEYINLHEVLLYPDSFNHDFEQKGNDRNILGMVGDGAMNNTMIISRHELRQAFLNKTSKTNTAIHEFVHLVDKTDGSVDGVPAFFLDKQFVLPWVKLIHDNIQQIINNKSDINPYGATNSAEFLAVVAEYFFERPDLLQQKHPDLYALLTKIFKQDPAKAVTTT